MSSNDKAFQPPIAESLPRNGADSQVLDSPTKTWEHCLNLARQAESKGRWETAENLYWQAIELSPKAIAPWFSLANLYHAWMRLPQAAAAYQRALELQPNSFVIYNNLGYTLQKQDRLDEAIACYRKALELRPDFREAEISLGNALHLQGKLTAEQVNYYAHLNNHLGILQKRARHYRAAETYFRQAIALQAQLSMVYYNLGDLLQIEGRREEALDCYRSLQDVKSESRDDLDIFDEIIANKVRRIEWGLDNQDSETRLKVAFISQCWDSPLPPKQNSVGACTYGLARPLAECCEVIVYALGANSNTVQKYCDRHVNYQFMPLSPLDLKLMKRFDRYGKYLKFINRGLVPPASTFRWTFPRYGAKVARDLTGQKCHIIHFQHTTQYIQKVRKLNPNAKLVLTLHHEIYPQSNLRVVGKRLKDVDLITCVSRHVTQKTVENFPEIADRCHTVYNGIEAIEFAREKDYVKLGKRRIKHIMYAGAVSPEKGIHVLIDALRMVVLRFPNIRLDLFGPLKPRPIGELFSQSDRLIWESLEPISENYLGYLKRQLTADIADKINFKGMVARDLLIESYYQADIFVFPSLWDEGFGLPPVEAMAAGTPVIATQSGAVVETVQNGMTGYLVEKNDPFELAARTIALLEDDEVRNSMGRAARKRALTYFTWENSVEEMLKLYASI